MTDRDSVLPYIQCHLLFLNLSRLITFPPSLGLRHRTKSFSSPAGRVEAHHWDRVGVGPTWGAMPEMAVLSHDLSGLHGELGGW